MESPALLGVLDGTLGLALAIGWLAVLGIGLYRYRQGTRSRERLYITVSAGGLWLAFSLVQVSTTLTGIVEKGVVVLAVGMSCAGVATGIRWWRIRTAETDQNVQA